METPLPDREILLRRVRCSLNRSPRCLIKVGGPTNLFRSNIGTTEVWTMIDLESLSNRLQTLENRCRMIKFLAVMPIP